jgi:hypothetical protein
MTKLRNMVGVAFVRNEPDNRVRSHRVRRRFSRIDQDAIIRSDGARAIIDREQEIIGEQ